MLLSCLSCFSVLLLPALCEILRIFLSYYACFPIAHWLLTRVPVPTPGGRMISCRTARVWTARSGCCSPGCVRRTCRNKHVSAARVRNVYERFVCWEERKKRSELASLACLACLVTLCLSSYRAHTSMYVTMPPPRGGVEIGRIERVRNERCV